ncbi:hypothetical protein KRX52_02055 [Pseudomonas sp. MAP12]|uniref:Resolvase/invertase-type recombinase catalytic domain-containing protein n=1 Tax=Geopseudomonas aromaticivorans TaxID=2849492 RepID=A0ABS6MS02_9GAMM|nr:hypothetical protein [Pseudomonas aromaticivorans]
MNPATADTSIVTNLLLSVMRAFAEFERVLIRGRPRERIAMGNQRDAYRSRKKALSDGRIVELRRRAEALEPKTALTHEFGISRACARVMVSGRQHSI